MALVAVAAAALVVAAGVAAAVVASQDESDDSVAVATDETTDETTADTTEETTPPPPEPVQIQSLTVDASDCDITVEWDASGNPDGRLELMRDGESIDDSLPVGSGAVDEAAADLFGDGDYEVAYELVAHDSEDQETDRQDASGTGRCDIVD
jgi:hypothetical protein